MINKEVLTDMMNGIDDAMDTAEFVLSRIDECGFCKYDYAMVKDGLSKVVKILGGVYDIMEFTEEE